MKTWTQGRILEGKAPLDSFSFPLHYSGPTVWEGLRAYKQDDGSIKIWKLKEHIDRLFNSAKILNMKIEFTPIELMEACDALIQANGNIESYLRPIAFTEGDAEGIHTNSGKIRVDIYCVPTLKLHKDSEKGIKMIVSGIVRGYPEFQMQAKTPANYSVLANVRPLLEQTGAQDAFLVDRNGYIVEATVANFFVFKGDVIMTPPNCGSILPGITRKCLAELLTDKAKMFSTYNRVPVLIEKPITKADLYTADCVVICGTYAEVIKVSEIDGRKIDGDDFYFKMLQHEYSKMVHGR